MTKISTFGSFVIDMIFARDFLDRLLAIGAVFDDFEEGRRGETFPGGDKCRDKVDRELIAFVRGFGFGFRFGRSDFARTCGRKKRDY